MGGNGNIRTHRNQSGTNGSRTLASILSSDSGAGAGSGRRIYGWYKANGGTQQSFYDEVFKLKYGAFANKSQLVMRYYH